MANNFRQRIVDDDKTCCFALLSSRTMHILVQHGIVNNAMLLCLSEKDLHELDSLKGVGEETIDEILAVQKFVKMKCDDRSGFGL